MSTESTEEKIVLDSKDERAVLNVCDTKIEIHKNSREKRVRVSLFLESQDVGYNVGGLMRKLQKLIDEDKLQLDSPVLFYNENGEYEELYEAKVFKQINNYKSRNEIISYYDIENEKNSIGETKCTALFLDMS